MGDGDRQDSRGKVDPNFREHDMRYRFMTDDEIERRAYLEPGNADAVLELAKRGNPEQVRLAHNNGYDAGHADGYDSGYDEGYGEGLADGERVD